MLVDPRSLSLRSYLPSAFSCGPHGRLTPAGPLIDHAACRRKLSWSEQWSQRHLSRDIRPRRTRSARAGSMGLHAVFAARLYGRAICGVLALDG